ncbi:MAG: ABC transporter permease [Vallitalea sp.]|jgi:molybdate transport system permease protein|nr:ABC transporter permease [Vallitalea sp.]
MKDRRIVPKICYIIVIIFIGLPFISLLIVGFNFSLNNSSLQVILDAMVISYKSTAVTIGITILIGTPSALAIARCEFRYKRYLDAILNLPLLLPPAVAGLLLLITFGRNGLIGKYLYSIGISIPFTLTAVILAQLFVALPLYIKTASSGFRKVDTRLEFTAMTLGNTKWQVFRSITLPLAKDSLITGAVLSMARALAEFGAIMMFAGNLRGKTQTLPLAIYTTMEKDMDAALFIALIMVIISTILLIAIQKYSIQD